MFFLVFHNTCMWYDSVGLAKGTANCQGIIRNINQLTATVMIYKKMFHLWFVFANCPNSLMNQQLMAFGPPLLNFKSVTALILYK